VPCLFYLLDSWQLYLPGNILYSEGILQYNRIMDITLGKGPVNLGVHSILHGRKCLLLV
jgi:hypothetical protein